MPRRPLIVLALLLALVLGAAVPPARAQSSGEKTLLMPGVTYERDVEFTLHGPVVLHVLTAPRPDGSLYRLQPELSNNAVVATEPLTAIEKDVSGPATAAGINGDYFNPDPGDPKSMLLANGVLVSPPDPLRSSLGVGADGALQVARVAFAGIWKGTGQRRPLTLNQPPSGGPVTLYTPEWGPTTPPETGAVVEDVISALPPAKPNTDLGGTVSQVVGGGGVTIPPSGAVLVARNSQAPILQREAPAGTSLFLRLSLTPDWSAMAAAIGGGPVIVQNGKAVFRAGEDIGSGLLNPRGPRSAVGQLKDGRIVLVTTDGGGNGYSVGMTNFELALALIRLGAVQAMALGSGPAATMAFDGTLLNRPPGAAEPELSDALLVLYTGVYVPEPESSLLSPNGDGVDDTLQLAYKVVRPSTISATVSDGKRTVVLATGAVDPGVHQLTLDGKAPDGSPLAEGSYVFSVTATDDQGRTTTAERPFVLDDTLASLTLDTAAVRLAAASQAALTIGFTLAHPASVRATIETRSGVVVRTVTDEKLEAGPQSLVWDGRAENGALAFGGAYLVRVSATNSIGTVDLTQPFTARRG